MEPTDEIIDQIAAGDHDGRLGDLVVAIVGRHRAGGVAFLWRITLDGDEWTEESVTLGELKFAEQHCHVTNEDGRYRRATRHEIDPRGTGEHALALIIAHLHKAQGQTLADATKRAEAVTAAELAEIVDEYEVVRPPKDDPDSTASTTS